MADINTLLVFALAGLVVNLAPGQDMLYVIARSISQGRRPGLASALGVFGGCFLHIVAAAFGLAGLLAAFPWSFAAIKYLGCGYLLYLGVRALLSAAQQDRVDTLRAASTFRAFRQGALTNALNPKVALFFLAFLPQFASAQWAFPVWLQMLLLGLWFNVSGLIVNGAVAFFASALSRQLSQRPGTARTLRRVEGVTLIGLGVKLAATR
jgi:threonine/homoserine/homoserine lactone efflux protein